MVAIQSITIFVVGRIYMKFVKRRYKNPDSFHDFLECKNRDLKANFNTSNYPNAKVLVEYDIEREIKSETVYNDTGDWTYFGYKDGKEVFRTSSIIASYVVIAFLVPGILIFLFFQVINISRIFINIDSAFLLKLLKITCLTFYIPFWSDVILIYSPFFKGIIIKEKE
ncbi:hypothetical protein [Lusitaniella coriacea]|uniref:hypothetical protein n=1 Tax=Lusitaniella coriacea TaxID=1983105 RepID=UPI003CE98459